MTLTTEQLSAVETTKEFRALLKYMRAIAKAEPESAKEKFELEEGLWRYASQKTIKAIVGHIDALEFALAANREAQPVNGELGKISVGRLPTMNQENYPGLGDWWVQLRIGVHNDEILARVYGATPEEATARAHALTAPPAPASEPIFFIEIEGDDWINAGRIPGSTFDFNNLPDGVNKLYAAPPAPAGEVVVTRNERGDIVAVTRQDGEGRVIEVIAESSAPPEPAVPDEVGSAIRYLKDTLVACNRFNYCADAVKRVENACRAAMLAAAPEGGNDHDTRR